MTTVSCTPVKSAGHMAACKSYLEDERTVMSAGWNLDPKRWHDEMLRTMEAYGHDVSGRAGAEPTLAYHEQLAFMPDECDMNGGSVGEREAMSYAWEYYTRVYPDQEVYLCLHDEGDRYCVHALVGRTDLATGRRHDRGAPEALDLRRQVKDDLDSRYGLEHVMNLKEKEQQMVYGPVAYSKVRTRSSEANAERIAARQGRSYKRQLFRDCAEALRGSRTMDEYKGRLQAKGYGVRETGKGLAYTTTNNRGQQRTFTDKAMRAARLSTAEVRKAVARNDERALARETRKEREHNRVGGDYEIRHDAVRERGQAQSQSTPEPPARHGMGRTR